MRLSDIRGERTLDVFADLIVPVSRLARDKDVKAMFERGNVPKGVDPVEHFLERVESGLPSLIHDHKGELVQIMATLDGVTTEEYVRNLNLANLSMGILELLSDEEFVSFFTSSQTSEA